jgi:outer membrane protein
MRALSGVGLVALAIVLPMAAASAQQAQRIGFINTEAVFQAAPGRSEAEAQFQQEMTSYQEQVRRMSDSLNAMITAYQSAQASLSAAERETRERAIRTREDEYRQRTATMEEQVGQRREQLVDPIRERIQRAVEAVRTEDGFSLILAQDAGVIVAYDRNLDITERVIARLRTIGAARPPASGAAPTTQPAGVTRPRP